LAVRREKILITHVKKATSQGMAGRGRTNINVDNKKLNIEDKEDEKYF
jgi:hypothetical protein